ncbi:MAG: DNA repair protein RecN [Omnitrophica bacterium RIFCSPLOWO2_12_FULL_44_17]|uniref:DNA repair protein RecN n=1 Tax=Candidatus Danuiimicrobium aquiferis TaxID=1801832 RepID=A0A1G1KU32_9BACT|nr:MAG: DNA repair protein RecN [Omnitrophica bacterium RIFCSPHIGHO2_02_FULL_45_28]OGW92634.1 MAG: DNA repair protein RecN [Omnitrophica bacterium RIFCSPHIGHO2_12_FULL_44_12]OGW96407.1 MAG: DNA repair protein RecN [Omnitrophica bacterium RIFCSPLOWO2_12_FULL_44_17]OGX02146.1 MAG: DNA repair protein RecN [Omnitrophica bacterium RIFCSPLOWO2_02_FULL_44_11]
MLVELHIENFILIDRINIEFSPRMNVLTGETGAGKSILIDAIRFVLGERMDGVRARLKDKSAFVEAVFEIEDETFLRSHLMEPYLEKNDTLLILRREQNAEGKSRAWVNQRMVNISALKEIGTSLIDIHGQYDHQLLLDPASHVEMIDRFAGEGLESLKEAYGASYDEYQALVFQKAELVSLEAGREREMDLLKYQIDEIERVELESGEEEGLKEEHNRLANSEKLHEYTARLLAVLDEDETAASSTLQNAHRELMGLIKLDPSLETLKSDYETVQVGLNEIVRTIRDYQEGLSFDQGRLEEIEKRLDLIEHLKRKYGGSVSEIQHFFSQAKEKYDKLANTAFYAKEIDQKVSQIFPKMKQIASRLTDKRKKSGSALKKVIESELKDLEIAHVRFECQVHEADFGLSGKDRVEFMISLNLGQPLLPLHKIISAGEVSRVMLAMKKALMNIDPIETLIFDEIDANIGGRLGSVTGKKLKEISDERQVLLITHLPQIASFADKHFKVSKRVHDGQTVTEYSVIDGEDKVKELAQMMSGKEETEISKKHARDMLNRVSS